MNGLLLLLSAQWKNGKGFLEQWSFSQSHSNPNQFMSPGSSEYEELSIQQANRSPGSLLSCTRPRVTWDVSSKGIGPHVVSHNTVHAAFLRPMGTSPKHCWHHSNIYMNFYFWFLSVSSKRNKKKPYVICPWQASFLMYIFVDNRISFADPT